MTLLLLQGMTGADFSSAMQGNFPGVKGLQLQQALLGNVPGAAMQQPYGRSARSAMQPLYLQTVGNAMQQSQQQARPPSPYAEQQSRQNEQQLQASPDRLGITPMQLAMLQQQRVQQNRSPQR